MAPGVPMQVPNQKLEILRLKIQEPMVRYLEASRLQTRPYKTKLLLAGSSKNREDGCGGADI